MRFPVNGEADGHKVDIIVAGYQECEWGGNCEGIWMEKFEQAFGETYVEIEHLSMQEIRIFVYIRKELREFVSRVCKDKEATGSLLIYLCLEFITFEIEESDMYMVIKAVWPFLLNIGGQAFAS